MAKEYIEVYGKTGVYIFTIKELIRGLDRENTGVRGELMKEEDFVINTRDEFCDFINKGLLKE